MSGQVAVVRRERPDIDLGPLDPARDGGRPVDRMDDDDEGLYALVEQVRRIRALTTGGIFDTDLGPLTARLREVADELEAASASPQHRQEVSWRERRYVPNCPIIGRSNVLAPPAEFELLEDGTVRSEITFGLEYQGPPGCVHGGIVALLFDAVLGRANHHAGTTGMTLYLDLDYRSPTPILEPIVVTGRQVRVDGRKVWAQGAIHHGERLCATAEGLFVMPDQWVAEYQQHRDEDGT
ncbi:MAG: PaaI family thioesterase [Dietzia sp.]